MNDVWALDLGGTPTWSQLTPSGTPPAGRYAHAAAYDPTRNRMLVYGGGNNNTVFGDVFALDLSTPTPAWSQLAPAGAPPAARSYPAMIYDPAGDRLVLFGGYGSLAGEIPHALQDTWTLDFASGPAWTQQSPAGALPAARREHRAVYDSVQGRMIVVAGSTGSSLLGDAWALDLSGGMAWSPIALGGAALTPRARPAVAFDPAGDRTFVFGGRVGSTVLADELFLPFSSSATANGSPPSRLLHKSAYDAARQDMYTFGGWRNGTWLNDLFALHLSPTPVWRAVFPAGAPPAVRSDHVMTVDPVGDRLLVFGGKNSSTYLNDTWQLNLSGTPVWSPLVTAGLVPARIQGAAGVYDPVRKRWLVFGGLTDIGVQLNQILALSLGGGTPTWSMVDPGPNPPPAGRYGHTAVYDPLRDCVILFGGTPDEIHFFNDVWVYHLSGTPRWEQVIPPGAPSGRYAQEAIYDTVHDRMVLFGGYGGSYLNDAWELGFGSGAAVWRQLSPAGVPPSLRDFPTGQYDPVHDRFVLFGGNTPVPGASNIADGDTWGIEWADQAVPALASLVDETTGPGTARLTWYTPDGPGVAAVVERTEDGGTWDAVARLTSDAGGEFVFEDALAQGGRYGYRLGIGPAQLQTAVTWLDIPAALAVGPGLAGAWPNPSRGAPTLTFTLASGAVAAALDVFDVAGRRVYSRDVATLGPGVHALDLRGAFPARAGVYLATLRAGGATTTRKFAILP